MSGYFGREKYDPCACADLDSVNFGTSNYMLSLAPHWRPGLEKVPFISGPGVGPTTFGPLAGKRVDQDSYITGRGSLESSCAACEVRYLPDTLFPNCTCGKRPCICVQMPSKECTKCKNTNGSCQCVPCQRTDLQPLYSRLKKSCNDLSETDASVYSFLPGAFQKGYLGASSVGYCFPPLQQRILNPPPISNIARGSYGSYNPSVIAAYA